MDTACPRLRAASSHLSSTGLSCAPSCPVCTSASAVCWQAATRSSPSARCNASTRMPLRSTPSRGCSSRLAATAVRFGCEVPRMSSGSWWASWDWPTCCRTRLRVDMGRQAEQRKERLRVEEERELFDLVGAELEDEQRPGIVATPQNARLILPERHLAVCADGRNQPRATAADTRPEPPGEDVLAAAEPQVVRRHRLASVLLDEPRQRGDVIAFEGSDVAGEKLLAGGIHRGRRIVGTDSAGLQRRARPLQRAVDRCHAHAEELGDLLGLPAQHLAQDQGGSLARR